MKRAFRHPGRRGKSGRHIFCLFRPPGVVFHPWSFPERPRARNNLRGPKTRKVSSETMHKTRRRIAGGPEEAQKRAMRRQATTAEVQENDRDKRQRRRGRRQTTKTTTKMTPTTKKTMHQISGVVNRIPLDSLRSPRRPLGTSEDSKKLIRITKNNNIQSLWKFTVCCLLGPSQGVLLELSWGFFGASWAVLRPSWAVLERS